MRTNLQTHLCVCSAQFELHLWVCVCRLWTLEGVMRSSLSLSREQQNKNCHKLCVAQMKEDGAGTFCATKPKICNEYLYSNQSCLTVFDCCQFGSAESLYLCCEWITINQKNPKLFFVQSGLKVCGSVDSFKSNYTIKEKASIRISKSAFYGQIFVLHAEPRNQFKSECYFCWQNCVESAVKIKFQTKK